MPVAEGKSFTFFGEEVIQPQFLELIPYSGDSQEILYETEEFSAVCPFSGLPDIGLLQIRYIPSESIVELKSLKYYLTSFRCCGIYQERATQVLYRDLSEALDPKFISVKLVYNVRGGIRSTTYISSSGTSDEVVSI